MRSIENIISGIYCIENTINNKKYVGQSINIYDRWSKHKSELRNNRHDNDHLQKSWNKYGEKNFIFYILETCDESELNNKERHYIELYNSLDYNYGYNLKSGGQDYNHMSDNIKNKISKSNKMYYKNNPDAIKLKSKCAYKQWSNKEIKDKILGKNNGMYGKTHSNEAKNKISKANKGRVSRYRSEIPVFCVELKKVFRCAYDACIELNIKKEYASMILQTCRGKGGRKTVGGYHWKFEDSI